MRNYIEWIIITNDLFKAYIIEKTLNNVETLMNDYYWNFNSDVKLYQICNISGLCIFGSYEYFTENTLPI